MTQAPRIAQSNVVSVLGERIDEVLRPLLPAGTPCALLDFPNHANVGDSAIWLGEVSYLRAIRASVVYTCEGHTFSPERLAGRLKAGTILIHGGGNLGDLWPVHQHFREGVIRAFPHRKIVQLPQSIHFGEKANLERARAVFNAHPDLTLLLRDERSLQFARNEFRATSVLCPDMAFALGPLDRPEPPTREIVWLSRTDIESSGHVIPTPGAEVDRTDWLEDEPSAILSTNKFLRRKIWHNARIFRRLAQLLSRTYDPVARQRVLRGCETLSRGKVVITDRLHGHILSLLMGIPHVVLDNNNGKLRSFHETWTKGCDRIVWADTPGEALKHARALTQTRGVKAVSGLDTLAATS